MKWTYMNWNFTIKLKVKVRTDVRKVIAAVIVTYILDRYIASGLFSYFPEVLLYFYLFLEKP